jgi:hypothetical protein
VRLSRVLDKRQSFGTGQTHDVVHRGHVPIEGDDHHGGRTPPRRLLDQLRCRQQRRRVDVHESWDRPSQHHGLGGGDKGIGWNDDLITGTDPERPKCQLDCISPVGHPDCELGTAVPCPLLFEFQNVVAADESGGRRDLLPASFQRLPDVHRHGAQVRERNNCRRLCCRLLP